MRNSWGTDFGNNGSAQSFNFSATTNNPIYHGANALKLENEVLGKQEASSHSSQIMNEQDMKTERTEVENMFSTMTSCYYEFLIYVVFLQEPHP